MRNLNVVHHMTGGDKHLIVAVVVKVKDMDTPTPIGAGNFREVGGYTRIAERTVSIVVKQGKILVGQGGGQDIREPVIVQVSKVRTHA